VPDQEHSLHCVGLKKVYPRVGERPEHVAVKSFSLLIKKGEIFGLLGPNGAGKTTLLSMLTGIYKPDKGDAWIAGHSLKTELATIHSLIGVCPQFDLLWPELSIEDHLLFYARMKGVPRSEEQEKVKTALEEVNLEDKRSKLACELSGGMKRRLSIAISMVGRPSIIFLDEPTTGLDPDNRRQIW
jgi:ABC-type multidrug transport system ATPase subunit